MIENKEFNDYIERYKKMPLDLKKDLVIEESKKILAFLEKLKNDFNVQGKILFNKEILDVKNSSSEEDFTEAMFVYIHSIEESLGEYIDMISKILYK